MAYHLAPLGEPVPCHSPPLLSASEGPSPRQRRFGRNFGLPIRINDVNPGRLLKLKLDFTSISVYHIRMVEAIASNTEF